MDPLEYAAQFLSARQVRSILTCQGYIFELATLYRTLQALGMYWRIATMTRWRKRTQPGRLMGRPESPPTAV